MKDFKHFGVKVRKFPDHNYHAVWYNLKTIRLGEGVAKELPPDKAEFYDVSLGTKCNLECPFCLTEDNYVETANGSIKIINIIEGNLVYTLNENTGNTELKPVEQLYCREYDGDLIEIKTESSIIQITPNHQVFTENRGWIEAEYLQLTDILLEI